MQTITVCTDAGHKKFHKESIAVWATYIRTPSQAIHSSGIISQHVKGSSQAELYALANALHIINKNYDLTKYKLIVYSDNLYALRNHLDGSLAIQKKDRQQVYDKFIRPIINKVKVYEARHVKAHLPKEQWFPNRTRFFMQDWCDQEVHRIMKIACKIKGEQIRNKKLVLSSKKEHN